MRVAQINTDSDELYDIERVELFGSMLSDDASEVGDVDVRVLARQRYPFDEHRMRARQAIESADASIGSIVDELMWPSNRIRVRLKNRSPKLDIQLDVGESRPLPDGTVTRIVYERPE